MILVRNAASGIEVLLVRRSSRSSFAPDAFVFPGGTVDPADYEADVRSWPARVMSEFRAQIVEQLPSTEPPVSERDALALVAAAIRELREEAAIAIEPEALVLFSHWITPPTEPRRYNTHFFIASADARTIGHADAVETHDAQWISPAEALERYARGEMHLVYPTIKHLERLTAFATVEELMRFAGSKPIITVMPWCAPSEGFIMPSPLEGVW